MKLLNKIWWAVRPLWVWRLVRFLVRSLWLAGLVVLAGWLYSWLTERPFAWADWAVTGAVVGLVLFLIQSLWPVPTQKLARRLDDRFAMRDQLAAAYEVAQRGPANYIERDLLNAADDTLGEVRRRTRFQFNIPWHDLEMALVVGVGLVAVVYGLAASATTEAPIVARSVLAPLPAVGLEPMVSLPGVPAEFQPAGAGQLGINPGEAESAGVLEAADAQTLLDELAEALQEQSLTQTAGNSLAQGDAEQAAEELRDLAQNAENISDEARADLAQSLRDAAEALEETNPEQAAALREAADALEQESSEGAEANSAAADALEDLAQMIESADGTRAGEGDSEGAPGNASGNEGGSQGGDGSEGSTGTEGGSTSGTQSGAQGSAGNQSTEEQSTGSIESLVAAGDSVPLRRSESLDPGSLRPAEEQGRATDRRTVPYVHFGASGAGGEQPSDPLTIPWRLRNVIERYFSPP
jgi:hypothetical protein